MLHDELEERPQTQEHHGVPVEPVLEPSPAGEGAILLQREGVHVAETPKVQVPRMGMVVGVGPFPVVIGRERDHPQEGAKH